MNSHSPQKSAATLRSIARRLATFPIPTPYEVQAFAVELRSIARDLDPLIELDKRPRQRLEQIMVNGRVVTVQRPRGSFGIGR